MNKEQSDKDIQEFFQVMKQEELANLDIQEYAAPKTKRKGSALIWWISGAAAVLIAMFMLTKPGNSVEDGTTQFVVSVELNESDTPETGFLLEDSQDLSAWESPTDALILDFKD